MRHACRLALLAFVLLPCTAQALPRGAVHLSHADFKRVGSTIVCGRVDGHWQAGTRRLSFWFVSHAQRAANARRAGHRATARAFRRRAAAEGRACGPLRFDLRRGAGVALHGRAHPRAGNLSNLDVIGPRGRLRDAVTSGTANLSRIYTAPSGRLYALFTYPTAIGGGEPIPGTESGCEDDDQDYGDDIDEDEDADSRAVDDEGADEEDADDEPCVPEPEYTPVRYCLLAELDPASREPTCVDDELSSIRTTTYRGANDSIQFDATGAVYYMGYTRTHGTSLRRSIAGVTTDYISDGNVLIDDFLVLGDGDVLVTGATVSTGARWLRRIEPSGRVHSIWSVSASFLRLFPDGNAYAGIDAGEQVGVRRLLTADDTIDPQWWIDRDSAAGLCADADAGAREAFCRYAGGRISESVSTADGRVFAIAGAADGGRLVQYFPEVRVPDSAVRRISVAELAGTTIAMAGVDADEHRVLVLHDTATDAETVLIGPDAELDAYHLTYDAAAGKLRFDGLRFADNKYVLGEVDLATGTVTYAAASTTRWTDLAGL
ncbi:MAG: hypothetical protein ACJ762_08885 [Solirubrobacteraceae bacterium]